MFIIGLYIIVNDNTICVFVWMYFVLALCLYCFYSLFSFLVMFYYIILMCSCRILIKITYLTSRWYNQQVCSMSDEPCSRAAMSRARLCFLHQHCSPRPTGAGSRRATKHKILRHPWSARSLSPANARKAAEKSANARRQTWNVHNYVNVMGSALRTEMLTLKQSYKTILSISNSI